jgi:epoxyqueuosine reductase QueG
MLGMNAGPERDPLELIQLKDRAVIAAYAQRRDYHDVIKGKLKELGGFLSARSMTGAVSTKTFTGWPERAERKPPSSFSLPLMTSALWAETRSIVMLGMNAGPERDPLELIQLKDRAVIVP